MRKVSADGGLTDRVIQQYGYLTLLRLDLSWGCPVSQNCLIQLTNLVQLNLNSNRRITDLNSLQTLRTLSVCGRGCALTQAGIIRLTNLTELHLSGNRQINDVNHLINLTRLDISGDSPVDDVGCSHLTQLVELNISDNPRVTQLHTMTQLQVLEADGQCGLTKHASWFIYDDSVYTTMFS